jgi:hypothetical protein
MTGLRPVPRLHVESNSNLLVRCNTGFVFQCPRSPRSAIRPSCGVKLAVHKGCLHTWGETAFLSEMFW